MKPNQTKPSPLELYIYTLGQMLVGIIILGHRGKKGVVLALLYCITIKTIPR